MSFDFFLPLHPLLTYYRKHLSVPALENHPLASVLKEEIFVVLKNPTYYKLTISRKGC